MQTRVYDTLTLYLLIQTVFSNGELIFCLDTPNVFQIQISR